MRILFCVAGIAVLIWRCATSMSISGGTAPSDSSISVPYKFHDHKINRTAQSIHYEYQSDSITVVYFDTTKVILLPNQLPIATRWDPETIATGSHQKYPSVSSKKEEPEFPDLAKRASIEGKVIVKAWIPKAGRPSKVIVAQSGVELFDQPVIEAVQKWNFQPAHSNEHEIVPCWAILEFDFVFQHGDPTVLMPY